MFTFKMTIKTDAGDCYTYLSTSWNAATAINSANERCPNAVLITAIKQ